MSGGIDKIFPEPPHEIRGATGADQAWIDETIEAGKSCCGWTVRPRPRELGAPRVAVSPLVAAPPKKKRTFPSLWRDRLRHPLTG